MYNSLIKNKYFDSVCVADDLKRDRKQDGLLWFEGFAAEEERLGKDLSLFTRDEILEAFKNIKEWNSYYYIRNINYRFKEYTNWYIENINPNIENNYASITSDDLARATIGKREITVISRDDLEMISHAMINPKDRYWLLALYEGLRGFHFSEVLDLKLEDVDFDNLTIHVSSRGENGEDIKITPYFAEVIRSAYEATDYHSKNGDGYSWPLIESRDGRIYKYTRNSHVDTDAMGRANTFRHSVRYVLNQLSPKYANITINMIQDSGIINFIKERAQELNKTPMEYLKPRGGLLEIEKQYNKTIRKKAFIIKYGDYLK